MTTIKVELPCATVDDVERAAVLLDQAAAALKTILARLQDGEIEQGTAIGAAARALLILTSSC